MRKEVPQEPSGSGVPRATKRLEPSPEELLERYVNGQEEAFTKLVEVVGERLFSFIRRFLANHHLAEDVYQTVLVKVATNAGTFDHRARLSTWMYRIARNACLDALRQKARRKTVPLEGASEEKETGWLGSLKDKAMAPDQNVSAGELGARIVSVLAALPQEQREVFLLKEDASLTFEEVGEILGCGKETAKSRMRYALRRLQNALAADARQYGLL